MPGEMLIGKIEFYQPPLDTHSSGVYAEQRRLATENEALRKLLAQWFDMFAVVRRDGTEGAILIDRTKTALESEFRYLPSNAGNERTAD